MEASAKAEADTRARKMLATVMQRMTSEVTAETTVTVVPLPSDDLKGRIIGREGRNIRAFEAATGCDLIIDDTPGGGHRLRLRPGPPRDRPRRARATDPGRPNPADPHRGCRQPRPRARSTA